MWDKIPEVVRFLGSGILGGFIFVLAKKFIFNKAKQEVLKVVSDEDKAKIKELYDKGVVSFNEYKNKCLTPVKQEECFSINKLKDGVLNVTSGTKWAKDIASIFNLRKLIIVGVILGAIYGYGWYKGRVGAPVRFDMRGQEATIQLNEHYLKIEKDGTAKVIDKDGNVLKTIKVQDIPGLRKALRPYGFMCEPIFVAGGSLGETGPGFEAGAGISWFKWYKSKLDSFITYRGLYPLGVSYSITDNSGIGLGAGIGLKGDKRVILYYKFKF
jgi:hypothetical protein